MKELGYLEEIDDAYVNDLHLVIIHAHERDRINVIMALSVL